MFNIWTDLGFASGQQGYWDRSRSEILCSITLRGLEEFLQRCGSNVLQNLALLPLSLTSMFTAIVLKGSNLRSLNLDLSSIVMYRYCTCVWCSMKFPVPGQIAFKTLLENCQESSCMLGKVSSSSSIVSDSSQTSNQVPNPARACSIGVVNNTSVHSSAQLQWK